MPSSEGRCLMYGGYKVSSKQVCDSFDRGKPGTRPLEGKLERPHNLHISLGDNSCKDCTYFEKFLHLK